VKNIYLVQPTTENISTVYFPYAIGCLASYAFKFEDINSAYKFEDAIFLREPVETVTARLKQPYLVGFSNYIWNFEYNKALAKSIKAAFPDCLIVFGGPQVPADASLLEECDFIDILQHNEGEVSFRDLLRALDSGADLKSVHNISFRCGAQTLTTEFVLAQEFDFPSPFESGFFDRLVQKHPHISFETIIESNRGCPYHCAYCSWGMIQSKVRLFPLERVFFDLEWCAAHKMEIVSSGDANFGMFKRDEQIVDKIIELKKTTGYPKKFQVSFVSYVEGAWERIFRIAKKLSDNDLSKGMTLSFQSMSPSVQTNIGRSNMDVENYKKQMRLYADAGVPTYTDLILGLPGETLESFKAGIEELLQMGQHTSLFVHLCEWLPLAQMGNEEYMKEYGIAYSVIPLNQPHVIKSTIDIKEYSRIITTTKTMDATQWKQMVLFSTCVLCFHHLRLLQFPALFLHREMQLEYTHFYSELLEFLLSDACALTVFKEIKAKCDSVIAQSAPVTVYDNAFGNVAWPFEEYAFLKTFAQKELFFEQMKLFLKRYIPQEELLCDLLNYQQFCLKELKKDRWQRAFCYDWKSYFDALLHNKDAALTAEKVCYTITDRQTYSDLAEYAKRVVWFGRRGGRNIYTSEIKTIENDE